MSAATLPSTHPVAHPVTGVACVIAGATLWGTTGTAQALAGGTLPPLWFGALRLASGLSDAVDTLLNRRMVGRAPAASITLAAFGLAALLALVVTGVLGVVRAELTRR